MLRLKAYRIIFAYAVASALWILLSDTLVAEIFADSVEASTQASMYKGWFYVGVMSAMLYALLRGYERQIAQQHEAVQKSETRLTLALNATNDGLWDWNLTTGEVYFSPSYWRMLGYEPSKMPGTYSSWETLLHPDDKQHALAVTRACIENRSKEFVVEFRMRMASGGWKWILARGNAAERDDQGRALQMVGTHVDMTERKEKESEIQRWMQRFDIVNATARQVFYDYDLATGSVAWRGATLEVLGVDLDDMNGPLDIWQKHLHPDDIQGVMRSLEQQRERCGLFEADYRWLHPGGRIVHIRDSGVFLPDETGQAVQMIGVMQDVTERTQALERLNQSEERFSTLFRLSPDSIVLTDQSTSTIVDVNDTYLRVYGYGREEVVGKKVQELGVYVDDSQRREVLERLARDGQVNNMEVQSRIKSGQIVTFSLSSQMLTLGEEQYRLTVLRDITDMKKMQEMMVQTEKMISVGGIAAGIAHEINNPLGIVLQAAQNLVQRTQPDFQKNRDTATALGLDMKLLQGYMQARKLDVYIADIQSAAMRASGIIRHMLDFSRRSESRRKVCDLTAIIDRAVVLASSDYDLKKSYDFKRIKIERDYADELPSFNCTETEIEQVLLNLLRNAAQALATTEPPVAEPMISIRAQVQEEFLRLEIQDNGPGMPPEVQRRVFEPFFTTKPPGVGTGLGLSVSYFIVTKGHGGRMSVSSLPGQGTAFTLELPLDGVGGASGELQEAPHA